MNRFVLFKARIRPCEHAAWLGVLFSRRPTMEEFRAALREEFHPSLITDDLLDKLQRGEYVVEEEQGYWDNR